MWPGQISLDHGLVTCLDLSPWTFWSPNQFRAGRSLVSRLSSFPKRVGCQVQPTLERIRCAMSIVRQHCRSAAEVRSVEKATRIASHLAPCQSPHQSQPSKNTTEAERIRTWRSKGFRCGNAVPQMREQASTAGLQHANIVGDTSCSKNSSEISAELDGFHLKSLRSVGTERTPILKSSSRKQPR